MHRDPEWFDKDYFECGLESGKSCFQNYRWLPELTIPLAMTIIEYLGITRGQTILDYGCAKGYLVHAFRLLYRKAWGLDISSYAINNVYEEAKKYCFLKVGNLIECPAGFDQKLPPIGFDYCIAKDVLEHIPKSNIVKIVNGIEAQNLFVVVPLGEGGIYNSEINNFDESHVTCLNEYQWIELFNSSKWKVKDFTLRIDGIKDSYYGKCQNAHGFFTLAC